MGGVPVDWVESCYLLGSQHLPKRFQVANFRDKWQKLIKQMVQTDIEDLYRTTVCLWSEGELYRLTARKLPESQYEKVFRDTDGWPPLARLMRVDQRTYLPDAMLTKMDRASMAVSLEVRVPLLDHRCVEFAWTLPASFKVRDGCTKWVLRQVLYKYVPKELSDSGKRGFSIPLTNWLRGPLREWAEALINRKRVASDGYFDADGVAKIWHQHLTGRRDWQHVLWGVLTFSL